MMTHQTGERPQEIVVFEEAGSGDFKIAGIEVYGRDIVIARVFDIRKTLPVVVDEPERFITDRFQADLVLDFLKHPDLSEFLVTLCRKKGIPVIASGQHIPGAITPVTCCGLGRRAGLGAYGEQFGVPEFECRVVDGCIAGLTVRRGASCGATWQVVPRLTGVPLDRAVAAMGREVQYLCMADPSAFDPVSGKSALHFAGEVHMAALRRALGMRPDAKGPWEP